MVLGLLPTLYTHPWDHVTVHCTKNGQCAISLTFFRALRDTRFAYISGGLSPAATSSNFDFNAIFYIRYFYIRYVPVESACSADKIKFLEQNTCLQHCIKLHDAGQRF